ncbi:MAG: DUF2019 domain-containing protein [Candidatus Dormibacteria bacterium]
MSSSIEELLATYHSTAVAWAVMQNDAKKANPLFDQLHAIFKRLRGDQAGRSGIAAFMDDPDVGVRIAAASHSLAWAPERATAVLEAIERDGPGLYRTTAKYTLKSFREGRLKMDW